MKITWLGQAGLLFETNEVTIMVDPYLSNSVFNVNAVNRKVPVDERFFKVRPDILICTHNHLDHTDPETLKFFLDTVNNVTVLASYEAYQRVRVFGGNHNYVMFNRLTHWTEKGIEFKAVHAEHSDKHAVGVVFECEQKTYYITGDTLYNEKIFTELPENIDVIFLPINGTGNNMNMVDAAKYAEKSGAKTAIPIHFGMFDNHDPEKFSFEKKVIPQIFKEIHI